MAKVKFVFRKIKNKYIIIDVDNLYLFNSHNWYICKPSKRSKTFYLTTLIEGKTKYFHRMILDNPENKKIDHKNRKGLDNRKTNLRFCTQSQNNANMSKCHTKKSSKFKGVSWYKPYKKWKSYICPNRSYIHLGYFDSEIEAAKTYNEASLELFGEFATLNIINF